MNNLNLVKSSLILLVIILLGFYIVNKSKPDFTKFAENAPPEREESTVPDTYERGYVNAEYKSNFQFRDEGDKTTGVKTLCFLSKQSGIDNTNYHYTDFEIISLWIENGQVQGHYKYLPSEKDARLGDYSGYTFRNKAGDLVFDLAGMFHQEGYTELSEEVYVYNENKDILYKGIGESKPDTFMTHFVDKKNLKYEPLFLKKIDCDELFKEYEKYDITF